jgi:hypothetical protein
VSTIIIIVAWSICFESKVIFRAMFSKNGVSKISKFTQKIAKIHLLIVLYSLNKFRVMFNVPKRNLFALMLHKFSGFNT